jgi:hypothetical protein
MVNNQDERVRLAYLKDDVKNAPSYDPDAELDSTREQEIHSYYGTRGERLPEQTARPTATPAKPHRRAALSARRRKPVFRCTNSS